MNLYYKIIIAILLLPVGSSSFGQQEDKNDIADYRPRYISLAKVMKTPSFSFPIRSIEVFDVRFDSSNTALLPAAIPGKEKLLRFKKSTADEVREYFESQFNIDAPAIEKNQLIIACFIKKLYLSNNIYVGDGQQVTADNPNFEVKKGVMTVLEFYAKQDERFIPLYRFDSMITGKKDIYRFGEEYIADILLASLRKLEIINWQQVSDKNKGKSLSEINSYYSTSFNIPILKETPRRGIYLRFEDFRKNTPLDTAFTVDKNRKGDFLYLKNQKGEDILQTELWGYCDGENMFIYSAENYFKLQRYDNTFIVYGAKDYTTVRKLKWNFGLIDMVAPNSNYSKGQTAKSYKLEFNLLQLDMEKGELF